MRNNKLSYLVTAVIVLILSCSKENSPTPVTPEVTKGVFVLDQGTYGHNNTALTYYDFSTSTQTTDYFRNVNGFSLGDTGSDFFIYGGKAYIVMNVSGYVAVMNSVTAQFMDTISFNVSGQNREPENIVAYGNKIFVSCNDGTVAVIDTASLAISKNITVGANPAQMTISGNNLFVSNTGGFNINGIFDSTVSIIDLSSLSETGKITVGSNPGSITADSSGNIYVACTGNYGSIGPKLVKVSLSNGSVVKSVDTAAGTIRFFNNALYTTGGYLGAANVSILNPDDFSAIRPSFVTDGTSIVNPYGLDIDPATGDVYVGDAKDYKTSGEVFCFDKTGKKKFSFSTTPGISPIRTQLIVQ
jgi:YVTN family beta-propeller protein